MKGRNNVLKQCSGHSITFIESITSIEFSLSGNTCFASECLRLLLPHSSPKIRIIGYISYYGLAESSHFPGAKFDKEYVASTLSVATDGKSNTN